MEEEKTIWEKIHDFFFPDKREERKRIIHNSYKIIPKRGELFLVYSNEIVIKKLPACYQNIDTLDIIKTTIHAQMEFEDLEERP